MQRTFKTYHIFLMFFAVLAALMIFVVPAKATEEYSGRVYIEDNEDLLTQEEEASLLEYMEPITEYGGAAFVTGRGNGEETARFLYRSYFGTESGIIFYIDMDCRRLCIFSDGLIYKSITKSRADEITNSVSSIASRGDYYNCATTAFTRILSVLDGEYIFRPMRYLHNLFISIMLSSIIMYVYVYISRNNIALRMQAKESRNDHIYRRSVIKFTGMSQKYLRSHTSSDSSGSGGSSGGGGGCSSGGGGSSGF